MEGERQGGEKGERRGETWKRDGGDKGERRGEKWGDKEGGENRGDKGETRIQGRNKWKRKGRQEGKEQLY